MFTLNTQEDVDDFRFWSKALWSFVF